MSENASRDALSGRIGLFGRAIRPARSTTRGSEAEIAWKVAFGCFSLTGGKPNGECRVTFYALGQHEPPCAASLWTRQHTSKFQQGFDHRVSFADLVKETLSILRLTTTKSVISVPNSAPWRTVGRARANCCPTSFA